MPFAPSTPEKEQIELRLPDAGVTLKQWTSYEFHSDFLTPSDGWMFEFGIDDFTGIVKEALVEGAYVTLAINGNIQSAGYIDIVDAGAEKGQGLNVIIEGRDKFGQVVDATADPTLHFKETQTLLDVAKAIFGPFGWSKDSDFVTDNEANRGVLTGVSGGKYSKSKKSFGSLKKDFAIHQLKPHNGEGCFQFFARICSRHGLWPWLSADGKQIIIGAPDFNQAPLYRIMRTRDGRTNVERGRVRRDIGDQPSVIIADGFGPGGEFARGRLKTICVNPFCGVDKDGFVLDEVSKLLSKYPDAHQITMVTQPTARTPLPHVRPMYLRDDESKTQDQLDNFVKREMSHYMQRTLKAWYVSEGHGQDDGEQFVPWAIDTTVDVEDEVADLRERLWVKGRTFTKSRGSGTQTRIDLLRLNSIQF